MEGIEYIYELCELLPRSGPGDNEFTQHAFSFIAQSNKHPDILDIGCGQGMQTLELARISNGKIIALDNHQGFLDLLMQQAKKQRLEEQITPQNMSMLEMTFEDESFDIIWSEGALYSMGFQNGLKRCHQLLRDNGYLVVTELVYTDPTPPASVIKYLTEEYPDIKNISQNIDMIEQQGFNLLSHFTLPESAWLDNYYIPMENVLPRLIQKYKDNDIALSVFENFKYEINFYRKNSKYFGYEFFIMHKI